MFDSTLLAIFLRSLSVQLILLGSLNAYPLSVRLYSSFKVIMSSLVCAPARIFHQQRATSNSHELQSLLLSGMYTFSELSSNVSLYNFEILIDILSSKLSKLKHSTKLFRLLSFLSATFVLLVRILLSEINDDDCT